MRLQPPVSMMCWLLSLSLGCVPRPGTAEKSAFDPQPQAPKLVAMSLDCDVAAGRWLLEVVADAWTGGGQLLRTRDGRYVESHRVGILSSKADGSREDLRLDLPVATNWADAGDGSTAFSCARDPDALFLLFDVDQSVSDCLIRGPHPEIWDMVEGAPSCAERQDTDTGL